MRIGDSLVGLRTTSLDFARWVDAVLAEVLDPEPVAPTYSIVVTDETSVRGRRPLHTIYSDCGTIARSEDVSAIKEALLADLDTLDARTRDDAIFVDAGVVELDGLRALVPSPVISAAAEQGRMAERQRLVLPLVMRSAIDPTTGFVIPIARRTPSPESSAGSSNATRRFFVVRDPVEVSLVIGFSPVSDEPHRITRAAALYQLASATLNLPAIGPRALRGLGLLVSRADCVGLPPTLRGRNLESLKKAFSLFPAEGTYGAERREVTHRGR